MAANLNIQGATLLNNYNLKEDSNINILAYNDTTLYKLALSNKTLRVLRELVEGSTKEIFNDERNRAIGDYSHAEGLYTIARGKAQHVEGKYNLEDNEDKYAHIIGGGNSEQERKNIHTVDWNGKGEYADDIVAYCNNNKPIKLSEVNETLSNKQNKITFGTNIPDDSVGSVGDIYCMIIK